jgi:hypothetical protein
MKIVHTIFVLAIVAVVGGVIIGLTAETVRFPLLVAALCLWLEVIFWNARQGIQEAKASEKQTATESQNLPHTIESIAK